MTLKQKPITVISRDQIRQLKAHNGKKPAKAYAVVMDLGELERIKNEASLLSSEQLTRAQKQQEEVRNQLTEAAKQRKSRLESFDRQRVANAALSDIEKVTQEENNYLLRKAIQQLEEQEDDIKHMNELMLNAKCVAIRDLQVEEKKMISKEKKEEEMRLDLMMEAERVADLKRMSEREKIRHEELRQGATIIRQQINERQEAAILAQEKRDQEVKVLLKSIEERAEQEKLERMSKIKAQKELMSVIVKANLESIDRKKHEKTQAIEEDKKLMQYLLEQEVKQLENEKLAEAKKAEREQELSRLRAAQQRIADKQAEQDALRAKRAVEAYEREWRKKEKEAAEKKAKMEHELNEERLKQQKSREYAIAIEAHKLKEEFYETLNRQKEIEAKLKHEELSKREKNTKYFYEIKAQIAEKEALRRKEREEFFVEGLKLNEKQLEAKKRLEGIKERKLSELRTVGVPEKYCKEIERQMRTRKRLSE